MSPDAAARLWNTPELDYMTHIVMRLFENKRCAAVIMLNLHVAVAGPCFEP